ncbi:unnamed protein product [Calypogeia fissa]
MGLQKDTLLIFQLGSQAYFMGKTRPGTIYSGRDGQALGRPTELSCLSMQGSQQRVGRFEYGQGIGPEMGSGLRYEQNIGPGEGRPTIRRGDRTGNRLGVAIRARQKTGNGIALRKCGCRLGIGPKMFWGFTIRAGRAESGRPTGRHGLNSAFRAESPKFFSAFYGSVLGNVLGFSHTDGQKWIGPYDPGRV